MEIYQILVQVWQKCFKNSASSPEAPGDSISLDFLTLSEKIHLSDCNNSSGASIFIGSSIALGNAWSDCGWIKGSNRDSLFSFLRSCGRSEWRSQCLKAPGKIIHLIYVRLLMTSIDEASCLLVLLRLISVCKAGDFCEDLWRWWGRSYVSGKVIGEPINGI